MTPVTANGQSVGKWVDQSKKVGNATQATSANKPTYNTNSINGLPVLTCNGTSTIMALASSVALGSGPWTIYAIGAFTGSPTNNDQFVLAGGTTNVGCFIRLLSLGSNNLQQEIIDDSQNFDCTNSYTGSASAKIMRFRRTSANTGFFRATGSADYNLGTGQGQGNYTLQNIMADGQGDFTTGTFAEIQVYTEDTVATGNDPKILAYLKAKYALTLP